MRDLRVLTIIIKDLLIITYLMRITHNMVQKLTLITYLTRHC